MADALKEFYNAETLGAMADLFQSKAGVKAEGLRELVHEERWEGLSLKARMRAITIRLNDILPGSYSKQVAALKKVAPHVNGFQGVVFPDFVEVYGLSDRDLSLETLKYLTPFSTSEFAIRPFIIQDQDHVMGLLLSWSTDQNKHVRRWCSEGCRPRLPWAGKIQAFIDDPSPIMPILENLQADPAKYVQKSVANNLNDISKDHPERVIDIARSWGLTDPHTKWIVKHACRSLLKAGHKKALPIFGFNPPVNLKTSKFESPKRMKIGQVKSFAATFENGHSKTQKLRLEYIIGYPRAKHVYEKIFFVKETHLKPGTAVEIKGKIDLEQKSTRKVYPGDYFVSLIVNGEPHGRQSFLVSP